MHPSQVVRSSDLDLPVSSGNTGFKIVSVGAILQINEEDASSTKRVEIVVEPVCFDLDHLNQMLATSNLKPASGWITFDQARVDIPRSHAWFTVLADRLEGEVPASHRSISMVLQGYGICRRKDLFPSNTIVSMKILKAIQLYEEAERKVCITEDDYEFDIPPEATDEPKLTLGQFFSQVERVAKEQNILIREQGYFRAKLSHVELWYVADRKKFYCNYLNGFKSSSTGEGSTASEAYADLIKQNDPGF